MQRLMVSRYPGGPPRAGFNTLFQRTAGRSSFPTSGSAGARPRPLNALVRALVLKVANQPIYVAIRHWSP